MNKQRLEIIITSVLAVVLVAAWGRNSVLLRQRFASPAQRAPSVAALPSVPAVAIVPPVASQNTPSDGPWVRDPFSGQSYAPGDGGVALELKGVIWDERNPQALINDSIVQIGDTIGFYKIVNITPQGIVVQDGPVQKEINLEH